MGMDVNWNAPAIIFYHNAVIRMDDDRDPDTGSGQGFIDRVIHYFIYQVMQSFNVSTAHVHTGPPANGFKTFQYLDIFRCVRSYFSQSNSSEIVNNLAITAQIPGRWRLIVTSQPWGEMSFSRA